jgi:hypothetical protein
MKMKLFKEVRTNPKAGTEGLHFVVTQDDAGDTVLHVFDSEDQASLYHGQLRGYGGIKRIGRLKGSKSMSFGYINDGVAKQFGADPRMIRHDQGETNPVSRKENYNDFDEWETDVFRAGATQVVRIGEDLFSAIKMKDGSLVKLDEEGFVDMRSRAGQKVRKESITVGAWYGDRGEIYRQTIKNNPLTRRKGESVRDFTSRCMSEEKASFPKTKQRIAVCLSKSRKRNPVYDTGSDE